MGLLREIVPREIVPNRKRVAFLMHADSSPLAPVLAQSIEQVSPSLGLEAVIVTLHTRADLEPALARLAALDHGGILSAPGPFTRENGILITTLAARHRIPAVYPYRHLVTAGDWPPMGPTRASGSSRRAITSTGSCEARVPATSRFRPRVS